MIHGTGGDGKQFFRPQFADVLFAPGGLLDPAKYFIVLADGIGHGESSKPSDGLRAKFPHIEAHQGSIYDLSTLPGGYDLIICAEVLEHLERPADALDQIVKLRPELSVVFISAGLNSSPMLGRFS